MTSRREFQRQQTRKAMLEALDRLIKNQSLRVAPPYKINVLTVEKEAGFSIGSMRNYPDVKDLIDREKNKVQLGKATSESKNFCTKEKNLNHRLDREKRLKAEYKYKLEAAEDALAKAHTVQAELVMALHEMLSHDQRLKLYTPKIIEMPNSYNE
ncbi:hypothetical protein CGG88_12015 [Vibrio parahaemolyticus]|uniref:hypothetical protein n=1 Tax=Vibrio parahaemolyticus TaxID=670 RepID=UPI001120CB7C|nr:hypothetical protein [Vibrio parahaemolyticus]TOQ81087.1 hypothetical protein CGG88_12015 [Vibrio parahaemolyticus]